MIIGITILSIIAGIIALMLAFIVDELIGIRKALEKK